ncbi:MAG TPA: hypothetical protein PKA41_18480 [Verrucomicrobiota bacterium]|nr:hypothetical protein [Verrucomicrobiota bacterium]
MKKHSEPATGSSYQLHDAALAADLEFPVAPDFVSLPPRLELAVMLARLEETMPWRSTRPGVEDRRLAEKIPVEFVL